MKTKKLLITSLLFVGISFFVSCKKETTKTEPAPNYTNFKITSVKLTAMPFVNGSSASWDVSDGPDVFFNMQNASGVVLSDGSASRVNNISAGSLPLSWTFPSSYAITNLATIHYVTVYDYDTLDPNDLIGYVGFKMDEHKTDYPTTITKSNGSLTIIITGSWY